MKFSIALAVVSMIVASACAGEPKVTSAADSCAVAVDIVPMLIAEVGKRPVVFSDENEQFFDSLRQDGDWYGMQPDRPIKVTGPSAALIEKLNGAKPVSPLKNCRDVRSLLARTGVSFGPAAVEKAINPKRMTDDIYAETILGLSMPVLSDDRTEALVLTHGVVAPLGGGGEVRYLRRDSAGRWNVVGIHGLWVS